MNFKRTDQKTYTDDLYPEVDLSNENARGSMGGSGQSTEKPTRNVQPWPAKRARLLPDSSNVSPFSGLCNIKSFCPMHNCTTKNTDNLKSFFSSHLPIKSTSIFGTPARRNETLIPVKQFTRSVAMFPNLNRTQSVQFKYPPRFSSISSFSCPGTKSPFSPNARLSFTIGSSVPSNLAALNRQLDEAKKVTIQQSRRKDWDGLTNEPKTYTEDLVNFRTKHLIDTDFIVRIGGSVFPCHKFVLEAHCIFFCGKNSLQEYRLPQDLVSSQAFEIIYEWMLNNDRLCHKINAANVRQILCASLFLGIEDLIIQCHRFIKDQRASLDS